MKKVLAIKGSGSDNSSNLSIVNFIVLFYTLFLIVGCREKPTVIGIQPLGKVEMALCDTVRNVLENIYGYNVVVLKPIEIPKHTFVHIKTPRYRADKLISHLRETKPDSLSHVLGFLSKDISTTKKDRFGKVKEPASKYEDWGVFGLGYKPGASSVVSNFRIRNTTRKNYFARLKKISVHEIGHNLGLPHCTDKHCVMRDAAESIKTIDRVELNLCEDCRNILK